MLQPSSHHIIADPNDEFWGNSGWKQDAFHQAISHGSHHPQTVHPEGLKMRKHRILPTDSQSTHQRNFNEVRLLQSTTCRKALNSLIWDVSFSLINSNLFFFFVFLGLHPWHTEVPKLGVKSELWLLAYITATAMPDQSHVCNLDHSSWIMVR